MPRRSWTRLAGCFAIELFLAPPLSAAEFEFQAGVAVSRDVQALSLEDRRGGRVVIGQTPFPMTQAIADWLAAQLAGKYGLDRAAVLLRGGGSDERSAHPAPIVFRETEP